MHGLREAEAVDGPSKVIERVSMRERLRHFTWAQFEMTMSTGAIAVLLSQQPFDFRGLWTIGKVFFLIDLVLFIACCCLITLRFALSENPFQALKTSMHHPHESFFLGAALVSLNLILYCIEQYTTNYNWPWIVKTLEILFWIYVGVALIVVVFQYHVIFDRRQLPIKDCMPAWVLPAYPLLVTGPLAGTLQYDQPQQPGLNILIGGIACQGLGFSLAFLMYSMYFERLVSRELPPPPKRPGMYVAVGPAAYTSNAMIILGYQARKQVPDDYLGITSVPVGDLWYALGVAVGIFLWLVAFWFFAVATVSNLSDARKIHFTLNTWAFIFPNAGLTIATIWIGNALNSTGIKAVAAAMTTLCVAAWFVVVAFHLRGVWKGQILWPGMDEDEEDIEGREHDIVKERKMHDA